MIEILEFIFQDFWHWLGTFLLIIAAGVPFHGMFIRNTEINNYDKKN